VFLSFLSKNLGYVNSAHVSYAVKRKYHQDEMQTMQLLKVYKNAVW